MDRKIGKKDPSHREEGAPASEFSNYRRREGPRKSLVRESARSTGPGRRHGDDAVVETSSAFKIHGGIRTQLKMRPDATTSNDTALISSGRWANGREEMLTFVYSLKNPIGRYNKLI
ncbi:hypothetical protein GWI33_010410 [Rhynchophorus ferrugineus]|uniref:Uncharacterized protein n=1 Tax=Rhynchophorus ferrugineus TaxID=354439 RepID=A0A834ISP1_RHYFE|nr:hypothetical protein GWI33_010410 [Rhynchophorus ferrugineus]